MAMARADSPAELSDIQRRMAQIRHDMHEEVQGAVRGAQSLTDWRSMVASHPWAALGAAAAVGYLAVPHRRSRSGGSAAHMAAAVAAASQVDAARSRVECAGGEVEPRSLAFQPADAGPGAGRAKITRSIRSSIFWRRMRCGSREATRTAMANRVRPGREVRMPRARRSGFEISVSDRDRPARARARDRMIFRQLPFIRRRSCSRLHELRTPAMGAMA